MYMKYIIFFLLAIIVLGGGYYWYEKNVLTIENPQTDTDAEITEVVPETPTSTPEVTITQTARGPISIIGTSTKGQPITAYHFGTGDKEILFVGGIHGGYSWNTNLLAYELIDYIKANPSTVPSDVTITIIPTLNPDGLTLTTGTSSRFTAAMVSKVNADKVAGRFNANKVDLNRNFDCDWAKESKWQSQTVSGGSAPFSEPEAAALRDYVLKNKPSLAVAWYSAAGGVYASSCGGAPSTDSTDLVKTYAAASGYAPHTTFDSYAINGDMVNWLAKENIPAISVLLSTHEDTDWDKNLAGVMALIKTLEN